jgi:hypothetical protein
VMVCLSCAQHTAPTGQPAGPARGGGTRHAPAAAGGCSPAAPHVCGHARAQRAAVRAHCCCRQWRRQWQR